jgi:phosphoribosylanthranilate isomerase
MRTRIKICGITNPADAELAASLGADAIGLNAYAQSPRYVNPRDGLAIVRQLPMFVEPVVILVNAPLELAARAASEYGARAIQTYADHPGMIPELDGSIRWIPAFSVKDAACLRGIEIFLRMQKKPPAAILVDAHVAGQYGGTGQTAPWQLLADFKPGAPLFLAGGLTPDNVAEAIRIVRPYAVDVAGGVESSPGKKDPEKLRRFIDAVRNVSLPKDAEPL